MTLQVISAPAITASPEFFRLPSRGGDPIFGLSRSTYYALEAAGKLQMKRLRTRGAIRAMVLVPRAAVAALIEKEGSAI